LATYSRMTILKNAGGTMRSFGPTDSGSPSPKTLLAITQSSRSPSLTLFGVQVCCVLNIIVGSVDVTQTTILSLRPT
jgi:hypothetical protein